MRSICAPHAGREIDVPSASGADGGVGSYWVRVFNAMLHAAANLCIVVGALCRQRMPRFV